MESQTKRKILLIDDDTSLLVTLSDFLKFEGYDVITADSGEQGLKRLKQYTPDLIILDMSMPGMGGVGFLKHVSTPEGKPRYAVLVLTARANMAEFFADVEVDGFIAKPCDPKDLLMEVARIIFLRRGDESRSKGGEDVKRRILLGEDDRMVNGNLAAAFADAGYVVDTVFKGPEVLEKAIVGRPDAIVVKLVMAGMNGDAVARMMKEMPNTRDIPVVLYDDSKSGIPASSFTQPGTGIKAFVRGNNSVLLVAAVNDLFKA